MVSPTSDPIGANITEELAAAGFDYIELSLRDIADLPGADLEKLAARLAGAGLACEACNNFFPPTIRLTGPSADKSAILRYGDKALGAAARLGASVVVFGSSGARNVPQGFPLEAAWVQLRGLLSSLGPMAARHGITIAVEHLNRTESNIINSIAEGWLMTREVALPNVRVLADAYHLLHEKEDPKILAAIGPELAHVHVAQGEDRTFPAGSGGALGEFFANIRASGYTGRCSIEAFTHDLSRDAARALRTCRDLAGAQLDVSRTG